MENWLEKSRECLVAAELCLRERLFRSAVSRSYYASFSVVTFWLLRFGLTPPEGREGWGHELTQRLVMTHLPSHHPRGEVNETFRLLRTLYRDRLSADYSIVDEIDSVTARRSVAGANSIMRIIVH